MNASPHIVDGKGIGIASSGSNPPDEQPRQPDATTFRVIRNGDWQKGIRLERSFWRVLAIAAKSHKQTLAAFIHRLLVKSEAKNQTSTLRVAAVDFLDGELERTNSATTPKKVVDAMQGAPIPSFALSADRRLYSYNRDFLELVNREVLGNSDRATLDAVSLSLTVPIPKLIETLSQKGRGAVVCEFRVVSGNRRTGGRARVLLAPASDAQILVAYVLPSRQPPPDFDSRTI